MNLPSFQPAPDTSRSRVVRRWPPTLTMIAPMFEARTAPRAPDSGAAPQRRRAHDARVAVRALRTFIVDDSLSIRGLLKTALEELAPVTVVGHAASESAATDWLETNAGECDLILTDIWLRSGSGIGLLEQAVVRAFRGKCVVFSHAGPELEKQCRVLGADAVFNKSTGLGALLDYCVELARPFP